jgi:hypothetical protein
MRILKYFHFITSHELLKTYVWTEITNHPLYDCDKRRMESKQ